jgi:hypothetical protein
MKAIFSVGSAPRFYNEDHSLTENEGEGTMNQLRFGGAAEFIKGG